MPAKKLQEISKAEATRLPRKEMGAGSKEGAALGYGVGSLIVQSVLSPGVQFLSTCFWVLEEIFGYLNLDQCL